MDLPGPARDVAIGATSMHVLVGEQLLGVGDNTNGQLGNASTLSTHSLVPVPMPEPIDQIASGAWHTLARSRTGSIYGWGLAKDGQLGVRPPKGTKFYSQPQKIPIASAAAQVVAGSLFSMALVK